MEQPQIDKSKLTPEELTQYNGATQSILEARQALATIRNEASEAETSNDRQHVKGATKFCSNSLAEVERVLNEAKTTIANLREATKNRR